VILLLTAPVAGIPGPASNTISCNISSFQEEIPARLTSIPVFLQSYRHWLVTHLLSVDLPSLDISYEWTHTLHGSL
jgi:uncharacterized membrane protein